MRRLLLSPLWLAGAVVAPVGRERIQGAILGAAALTLITGYVRAEQTRLPVTPEYIAALDAAEAEHGTLWDEPVDLAPLMDSAATEAPAFAPPIPQRKPDIKPDMHGYTAEDRAALDNLFAQVTQ